jgi:hypothetical protein
MRRICSAPKRFARARVLARGGSEFLVPSRTDRALHNILHAEIHHLGAYYLGRLSLRDAHELAVMSKAFAEEIDWEFILARMRRHHLATVLESYVLAARVFFAAGWPFEAGPSARAAVHFRRVRLQLRAGWLERFCTPWANLRAALARHRMEALYGPGGAPLLARRIEHCRRFLARRGVDVAWARLFRG